MAESLARGFGAAIIIPAIASTLKQAQREAEKSLHVLADYRRRAAIRTTEKGSSPLTDAEKRAARHFGMILVEQGINGTTFFLFVKIGVLVAGPLGGMLAQLGITGNTIITPHQTQKFNPAQLLFDQIASSPDWISLLRPEIIEFFALASGGFAVLCGYGCEATKPILQRGRVQFM